MSFINLEFMGIQSPDIMADSIEAKQMLCSRREAWSAKWPYIRQYLALHFIESYFWKAA